MQTINTIIALLDHYEELHDKLRKEMRQRIGEVVTQAVKSGIITLD